ncbi:MAG: protein jag [Spirochaetes bacterium]|nr:MAG: protein jag [Spirochaetota bacterium]
MVIREYEGRTEREAIRKAVEDLGVESDKLKIEVIEGKSKFFSFGNPVKIRVYLENEEERLANRVKEFITELFKKIDVNVEVDVIEEVGRIYVEISSDNAGLIIGKRGKTLEALQLLVNVIVNKDRKEWKKVVLDIAKYRDKRENTLRELALKIAEKVKKTGKSQLLEPMNPFERRIIHITLQNDPLVDTRSEGVGVLKKVRIYPKKNIKRKEK